MIKKSTFKKLSRLEAIYYEEKMGDQTIEYVALYDPEIISEKEVTDFIKKSNNFDWYYCKEIVSMRKEQFESIFLPSKKEKVKYDLSYSYQIKKENSKEYMNLEELFDEYEKTSKELIRLINSKSEVRFEVLFDINRKIIPLFERYDALSSAIRERLSKDIVEDCYNKKLD